MKKIRNVFFLFFIIAVATMGLAAEDLWLEGKDYPSKQVNKNLKVRDPGVFKEVAKSVNEAVVNISSTIKPKKNTQDFRYRGSPWRNPQNDEQNNTPSPFDDFFDRFFGGPNALPKEDFRQQSLGSGFIINASGYIVTNNHVVEKADEIKVIFADETESIAKLVGRDQKTDLALIKVDGKKNLQTVILGDSKVLQVGDVVIAIGNPFGLSHSVTQGIVSAKERSIGFGTYDDFIQTDASINPGNSGGPLLNINGEVIGINTAIVPSGQRIGFAIPINLAKGILKKLKSDGRVVRGWLGVLIQKVTDDHATALKLDKREGALVAEVMKDSPAKKAGIETGDVIVRFDGKKVRTWHDLPLLVAETEIQRTVEVDVVRNGKTKFFKVTIEKLEDAETETASAEVEKIDALGLKVQTLTRDMARSMGLEETVQGVVVTEIDQSSQAFAKGLLIGDVIMEINQKEVKDRSSYEDRINSLKKNSSVLLLIKRNKSNMYIAFTL